ncbi:carboxypeptidase regulatory-like domain-containing protein [bacterium AH-315-M10]|nr:carboxypeptidase regulatory-like domain-containing protein [bacterium AH-315-M10]
MSASIFDDKIAWYENQLARDNAFTSAPNLIASSDSGVSSTDNVTSDTTPTFTGTTEAGSSVTLTSSIDGAVGTVTADTAGRWEITSSALSLGSHSITATATDGPASATSSALSVTIGDAPSASNLDAASDSGALDTDKLTSNADPVSLLDFFEADPGGFDTVTQQGNLSQSLSDLLLGRAGGAIADSGWLSDFVEQDRALGEMLSRFELDRALRFDAPSLTHFWPTTDLELANPLDGLLERLRRRFWTSNADANRLDVSPPQ